MQRSLVLAAVALACVALAGALAMIDAVPSSSGVPALALRSARPEPDLPQPDRRLETVIAALDRSEGRLQAALDLLTARAMPPPPFEQFPMARRESPAGSRPRRAGKSPGAFKPWRATVRKDCNAVPLK